MKPPFTVEKTVMRGQNDHALYYTVVFRDAAGTLWSNEYNAVFCYNLRAVGKFYLGGQHPTNLKGPFDQPPQPGKDQRVYVIDQNGECKPHETRTP